MQLRTVSLATAPTKILGQGSYGIVYLYNQRSPSKTQFAVKVSTDPKDKSILRREQILHQRLYLTIPPQARRYIVEPVNVKGKPAMYAMVYQKGFITLSNYMKHEMRMFKSEAKEILTQIRKAILSIWSAGYIHTDLHVENLLIDPETLQIKVIDFGLAVKSKIPKPIFAPSDTRQAKFVKLFYWYKKSWSATGRLESNPNLAYFGVDSMNIFHTKTKDIITLLRKVSEG